MLHEAIKAAIDLRHGTGAGLLSSAPVATLDGERHVADLCAGDVVVTRDSGPVALLGLIDLPPAEEVVEVQAEALGCAMPECALRLPAESLVLPPPPRLWAEGGQALPLRLMAGEAGIDLVPDQGMPRRGLLFARAHVIYVAGVNVLIGPAAA